MAAKRSSKKVNRSSITGRFIKSSTVERHPKTTTTDTVKKRKKRSGK